MKRKFTNKLNEVHFSNKWRIKHGFRGDYTLIGVRKEFISFNEFAWRFCFFGLELHFWFVRKLK